MKNLLNKPLPKIPETILKELEFHGLLQHPLTTKSLFYMIHPCNKRLGIHVYRTVIGLCQ